MAVVADPLFRLACAPGVLAAAPDGWVAAMLEEGELAVLADDGGLDAITALAHDLDMVTVPVLRAESTSEQQEATVMAYAAAKPLVWIAGSFGDRGARLGAQARADDAARRGDRTRCRTTSAGASSASPSSSAVRPSSRPRYVRRTSKVMTPRTPPPSVFVVSTSASSKIPSDSLR